MTQPAYRRILLKLSGEALLGSQGFGIDPGTAARIAQEVHEVREMGVQVAVVMGGGNFIRGATASALGIERVAADHMGMLATVMNSLALQDALEKVGVVTRVQSAIEMQEVAEIFDPAAAGAYGLPALAWLLEPLVPGRPDLRAQDLYARTHEWAVTDEDVLRRRTTGWLAASAARFSILTEKPGLLI